MQKIANALSLSRQVARDIRRLIQKNELVSGQKLSEQKLCDQLGVSRTPLREALRVLSAEGLVKLIPNRGAYVAEVSIGELRHMFETMSILEGSCARLATERFSDADLDRLEELHNLLEARFQSNDPHGYVSLNKNYHVFIQEKTGNPVLNKMVSQLRDVLQLHRYRQIYRPGRMQDSIGEHRRLMEAFQARDAERAEKVMRNHLLKQYEALVTYYAEQGLSTSTTKKEV